MKKNVFKKMLLVCTCLTIGTLNVKAEVGTLTADGFSINATAETGKVDSSLTVKLNIPTTSPENAQYYTYFVNAKTDAKPSINADTSGCGIVPNQNLGGINQVTENGEVDISKDWYIAKGYTFAYIIEEAQGTDNTKTCKITDSPISVTKPNLPSINNMYTIYAQDNSTRQLSVFANYPTQKSEPYFGSHDMTTKIGIVSDKSIIINVTNGKSGSYEELLTYAKNANNGTNFNFNNKSDNDAFLDLSSFNISNGNYYYIYTKSTDTSYIDLDGVNLVYAQNNELIDDLPALNDTNRTSTTGATATKNPPTGVIPLAAFAVLILASLGMGFFALKAQKQQG